MLESSIPAPMAHMTIYLALLLLLCLTSELVFPVRGVKAYALDGFFFSGLLFMQCVHLILFLMSRVKGLVLDQLSLRLFALALVFAVLFVRLYIFR